MSDKAVITCALNGVLTDPKQHNVPVTPEQMAREAKAAFNAGASIMHIHLRQQEPGKGHLPSWDVAVSKEIQQAIREACPGVIINHTTGTSGPNYSGALDCVRETRPEIAACNAGSLNYLKVKSDNTWAWPPMMFDNAVEKVQEYLDTMKVAETIPEFECFDVGIVRCVGMYRQTGMYAGPLEYNFVMGVASGMPADPELLPILLKLKLAGHRDRSRRNLAAAPALRRFGRPSAHRAGGYLLSGRWRQGDLQRSTDRSDRGLCAQGWPRDREPGGSAKDFWGQALVPPRHCERSEAIHLAAQRKNGLLRRFAPRNDGVLGTTCRVQNA
jgi:3-keto-5-aminohexanoate cleavage enzyme